MGGVQHVLLCGPAVGMELLEGVVGLFLGGGAAHQTLFLEGRAPVGGVEGNEACAGRPACCRGEGGAGLVDVGVGEVVDEGLADCRDGVAALFDGEAAHVLGLDLQIGRAHV